MSNHNAVIVHPPTPPPFLCVRVVSRITVCHAVKPMPTGCLHMMGCVRPPKRTAGGPTGTRVHSMGVFVAYVWEKERKIEVQKKRGGYCEKSLFEEALAPSKPKLRTCLQDQHKKENLSTAAVCFSPSWKIQKKKKNQKT